LEATEKFPVLHISDEGRKEVDEPVVKEFPLTISFNNQELVTLLCSPVDLKYLAVGYLFSEGLLKGKEDIKKIVVDDRRGMVWVETKEDKEIPRDLAFKRLITTGCGRGASFYSAADLQNQAKLQSQVQVAPAEILALANQFQHHSEIYRTTHGVHSAALCDTKNILLFSEDVGRHNAIDKIFGQCILSDIPTDDRIMTISGRVSSEMLLKVMKKGVPIIVSIAAPTSLGVKLANDLDMTLVGLVKGREMRVYSGSWRIKGQ
jgi:FdhD protein